MKGGGLPPIYSWHLPQSSPTGRGIVCVVTPIGLASPPTPLRLERGVICPADCHFAIKRGSNAFFVQQVAVITPLSIRRGVGGEAVLVLGLLFYIQLDIPSVVAMAVSTEIITLRIVFHFSFFIRQFFFEL